MACEPPRARQLERRGGAGPCIGAQNIQQKNISSFKFFPTPPTTKNYLPVTKQIFCSIDHLTGTPLSLDPILERANGFLACPSVSFPAAACAVAFSSSLSFVPKGAAAPSQPQPALPKARPTSRPPQRDTAPPFLSSSHHVILGSARAPCRPTHPYLTESILSPRLSLPRTVTLAQGLLVRPSILRSPVQSDNRKRWRGELLATIAGNPHRSPSAFCTQLPVRTN